MQKIYINKNDPCYQPGNTVARGYGSPEGLLNQEATNRLFDEICSMEKESVHPPADLPDIFSTFYGFFLGKAEILFKKYQELSAGHKDKGSFLVIEQVMNRIYGRRDRLLGDMLKYGARIPSENEAAWAKALGGLLEDIQQIEEECLILDNPEYKYFIEQIFEKIKKNELRHATSYIQEVGLEEYFNDRTSVEDQAEDLLKLLEVGILLTNFKKEIQEQLGKIVNINYMPATPKLSKITPNIVLSCEIPTQKVKTVVNIKNLNTEDITRLLNIYDTVRCQEKNYADQVQEVFFIKNNDLVKAAKEVEVRP